MAYDVQAFDKLRGNFELLRNMLRHSRHPELKVDLSVIERIIHHDIPDALRRNAPADFHVLFTDFKAEYERFKDFILYDKLIGKNIVALGGGFSSGKSSFLNALMKRNVLPSDIDPSTSVPTYIVSGQTHQVQGINVFDTKIDMEVPAIRRIAHGFGRLANGADSTDEEPLTDVVTLGHILNSVFFSTPLHGYDHIAFLDTPGYSKPDDRNYTAKTDELIARNQLNSANFILWFVQADAGTITEEDIAFIRTLREDIPKLVIVNKADKKTDDELARIVGNMKQVLDLKGIPYVTVLAFSNKEPDRYDSEAIRKQLDHWNQSVYESNFARSFKTLFMRCKQFYEEELEQESRRLNRLNTARILTDEPTVAECLDSLIAEITRNIAELKRVSSVLKQLQTDFFTEIKIIADIVGIAMPEPSEIDLIQDKRMDPLKALIDHRQTKGMKPNPEAAELLQSMFTDLEPVMHKQAGGSRYTEELAAIIKSNCDVDRDRIRIHDVFKKSEEYAELFQIMR